MTRPRTRSGAMRPPSKPRRSTSASSSGSAFSRLASKISGVRCTGAPRPHTVARAARRVARLERTHRRPDVGDGLGIWSGRAGQVQPGLVVDEPDDPRVAGHRAAQGAHQIEHRFERVAGLLEGLQDRGDEARSSPAARVVMNFNRRVPGALEPITARPRPWPAGPWWRSPGTPRRRWGRRAPTRR